MKKQVYYLEPRHDRAKSFYRKATVVQDGSKLELISYTTLVAEINLEERKAIIHGEYSVTTLRHIREFFNQFAPAVQTDIKTLRSNLENWVTF